MSILKTRLLALGLAPALALAMHFEGTVFKTYKDPVGIPTDCTGHTGADVVLGKVNTPAECQAKLEQDMLAANAVVDSCITAPLNGDQRSALSDFAFNVGGGAKGVKDGLCHLKSSGAPSTMARLFNQQRYTEACHEFPKWNKPTNLRGLQLRRAAEEALCLKPI